ncbi:carbohydrate ABC transporter permease [Actinomadura sp. HBU206391]|uniref:carbohydrate ABC transporter permease n=1 Tax=Actinomadura sp. HBU206391 TaxID=2731692 RepID=UPI001650169F|nr:sugar ABC transporter permease [Actinomadura sp. HBU206391]MBC6460449.1 sugar ABC transporter permease [Actinomadura sp. HBU206391]
MKVRLRPRRRAGTGVLAAPYLIGTALVIGLPLAGTAYLALTDYHGFGAPAFTGTANLRRMGGDDLLWTSLRNSAILAAIVVPLRLVLSAGCALLLTPPTRTVRAARAAVYLPTVVPDAAWALLWLWLLNPLYGPLPLALEGLGLPSPGWLTSPWGARAGLGLMVGLQIGESFVVALAARQLIPARLYEAAAMEGARPGHVLRRVTLPLLSPVLVLLALRDLVMVLQITVVPVLLVTEGGPYYATLTTPLYLYRRAFDYGELGYASGLAMMLIVVTAGAVAAQILVLRRLRLL